MQNNTKLLRRACKACGLVGVVVRRRWQEPHPIKPGELTYAYENYCTYCGATNA